MPALINVPAQYINPRVHSMLCAAFWKAGIPQVLQVQTLQHEVLMDKDGVSLEVGKVLQALVIASGNSKGLSRSHLQQQTLSRPGAAHVHYKVETL